MGKSFKRNSGHSIVDYRKSNKLKKKYKKVKKGHHQSDETDESYFEQSYE